MSLATAVLSHFRRLKRSNGVSATVKRGAGDAVPVTIVLGATDGIAVSTRETTVAADAQEILIEAADYKPTGDVSEPQDGDVFSYDEAGQTLTVEARPPNANQKCFIRWQGGQVYAVQGKVVNH